MERIVKITVEGGLIQDIELPEGVTAVVYDYDIECVEEDDLTTDTDGNQCIETVWG